MQDILKYCTVAAVLFALQCTIALPVTKVPVIPWHHPCTPSSQYTYEDIQHFIEGENATKLFNRLLEKTKETLDLVRNIRETMAKRFNETELLKDLRNLTVLNRSEIPEKRRYRGYLQNISTQRYSDHYNDLSKVAVVLEQVHKDENEEEMKNILDDLTNDNFSMQCELYQMMWIFNLATFDAIDRSFMPRNLREMGSTFKRYKRDFVFITEYENILQEHYSTYYSIKHQKNLQET